MISQVLMIIEMIFCRLQKKYGLTAEEINFIETTVKPMDDDLENA